MRAEKLFDIFARHNEREKAIISFHFSRSKREREEERERCVNSKIYDNSHLTICVYIYYYIFDVAITFLKGN